MSIITTALTQNAVLWMYTGRSGFGKDTFAAAVQIECRWDDTQELFLDAEGEERLSNAIIQVDRDIILGSYLLLGALSSANNVSDPRTLATAYAVRQFKKNPFPVSSVKEFLRRAIL